jgi:hypothetical protein
MLRLSVALVAVVFWYIAPRCGKLPEWQGIPIPCPIKTHRSDALNGIATPFCLRAASVSVVYALRRVLTAGNRRSIEHTKPPVYPREV